MYRICKQFEIESGHFLAKHQERCRFPHGHTRKIEVTLISDKLDQNDMVCDFKVIKLALEGYLDQWDHAMVINTMDKHYRYFKKHFPRVIGTPGIDPTTEVIARMIFLFLKKEMGMKKIYPSGKVTYRFSPNIKLEKIRVWETASSWAEFWED